MKVEIVDAQLEHVRSICEGLRERERKAFERLGDTAERLLTQEVSRSLVAYAGLIDEKVVALWGARTEGVLSDEAYIWLVCAEDIEWFPVTFARHSREAIEELRLHFRRLYGLVIEDFTCSVKWLEWLGFVVDPPKNGFRAFRS